MASSSSSSVARPLPQPMVLATVILLLSSISVLAAEEPPRASARPPAVAAGRSPQDFLVATAPLPDAAGVAKNGPERRTIGGMRMRARRRRPDRGRGRGGGTGAWAFSAMLPRVRVPPSGSSACHNSMPSAAYAQFYACGGSAGSP